MASIVASIVARGNFGVRVLGTPFSVFIGLSSPVCKMLVVHWPNGIYLSFAWDLRLARIENFNTCLSCSYSWGGLYWNLFQPESPFAIRRWSRTSSVLEQPVGITVWAQEYIFCPKMTTSGGRLYAVWLNYIVYLLRRIIASGAKEKCFGSLFEAHSLRWKKKK